jgi:hypothetical protein
MLAAKPTRLDGVTSVAAGKLLNGLADFQAPSEAEVPDALRGMMPPIMLRETSKAGGVR